ncbi:MAG: transketolase, partial [Chitinophagaceae bacterium]
HIYKVKGWDYAGMCEAFEEGISLARETHTPVLFHVEEITQPQGHSTSGSHERYKSRERLEWEREWDGIKKMREWILANALAVGEELETIEHEAKEQVRDEKNHAWEIYLSPIKITVTKTVTLLEDVAAKIASAQTEIATLKNELASIREPLRRDVMRIIGAALNAAGTHEAAYWLRDHYNDLLKESKELYNSLLYNEGQKSALKIEGSKVVYDTDAPTVNGFEVLNRYFDQLFAANPKVIAFGEDLGYIGDVNQGFSGLQAKHGDNRIFDTGIRELTLLYGLEPLSDDVASLFYRTKGQQSCPIIVRTRGHRLEGIWHSGSPMGMVINALRGMYVCVPRNMTQAVGMYNTLLRSNDPAIVVECLNGYRLKEKLPANLLDYTVPLGVPEFVKEGTDITLVSYGSTLRVVVEAAQTLDKFGISCEVIDVQTLLPFDLQHKILDSLKKTNRIAFIDEDVPGGATAYMFQKVMEEQGGYKFLDVAPRTISAKAHRPPYGSDGDYFSKPNTEEITTVVKAMLAE